MPNINITETEETFLSAFDVTDNTVLIPILYTRKYDIKDGVWTVDSSYDLAVTEFSNYASFKSYINSQPAYKAGYTNNGTRVLYIGTSSSYQIDRSYVMAYECLLHGLKVVIKPIALSDEDAKLYYDSTLSRTIILETVYHTLLEEAIGNGALEEFKSRNIYNIKFITSGGYANTGICSNAAKTVVADSKVVIKNTETPTCETIRLADAQKISGYEEAAVGDRIVVPLEDGQIRLSDALLIDSTITIKNGEYDPGTVTQPIACTMGPKLVDVAVGRQGDAVALIELRNSFESDTELLGELMTVNGGDDYKYAAAFYPWINMTTSATTTNNYFKMPACFGYLMAYANSVRSNANWFAAAGTQRGFIPTMVAPIADVTEALMHALQCDGTDSTYASYKPNIAVNPIMDTGNYGVRIWGNKVGSAMDSTVTKYSNYLNVRILVCDIRKQLYHSSIRSTFEPNDDIAWLNFKSLTNTLLEKMKSGRGIQWYRWTKETATELATIKCRLEIKPIEAVDSFDITIVLTDEDISVSED